MPLNQAHGNAYLIDAGRITAINASRTLRNVKVVRGGTLRPADGATITIESFNEIPGLFEWIDESEGGTVVISSIDSDNEPPQWRGGTGGGNPFGTTAAQVGAYSTDEADQAISGAVAAEASARSAADVALGARVDSVESAQSAGMVGFATRALMEADLDHAADTLAYVTNDSTPANNGAYIKSGASGAGSWVQSSFDRVALVETQSDATAARFAEAPGINLYDPNLAEDGYYINTSGNRAAASTWAWTGLIPITEGVEYTLWYNMESGSPQTTLNFFGATGLADWLGTQATLDIEREYSDSNRTIRFVAPAASYVANNMYAGLSHTTGEFEARADALMLEVGDRKTTFAAYELASRLIEAATPSPVLRRLANIDADLVEAFDRIDWRERPIRVTKIGSEYYVRSRWDDDTDIVARWIFGTSTNGVIQPSSVSLIPAITSSADLPTEHVVVANVIKSGEDDPGPWRFNGTTVGANHGHPMVLVSATAHGKTVADIGSRWQDSAAKQWTILKIRDADKIEIVPAYTRDADNVYSVVMTFTGPTLTHVSGATNTGNITVTASPQGQIFPSIRSHVIEILTDEGVDLMDAADGDYLCQSLAFAEYYVITSLAELIGFAQASVGGGVEPDYTDPSIGGLAEVAHVYHVTSAQHTVLDSRVTLIENVKVGACYILQSQVMGVPSSRLRYEYIPDTLAIGGSDYGAGVDITSASPQATATPASWRHPTAPPSRMIQVVTESDGTPLIGLALEIDETVGIGRPALRAASLGAGHAAELRITSRKQYLIGYGDGVNGTAMDAGTRYLMRARRRYFHPSRFGWGA